MVKARIVSVSSILASFNISSSKASPQITIDEVNSVAKSSARSLFFSIIFTLAPSKFVSNNLARFKPIFPPPMISILVAVFSSCPKDFKIKFNCSVLATTYALSPSDR